MDELLRLSRGTQADGQPRPGKGQLRWLVSLVAAALLLLPAALAMAQTLVRTLDDPTPQAKGSSLFAPNFGFSVAKVGDVNGDSIPDMAVGAPGQDVDVDDQGQVFIFSGADGSLVRTLDDPNPQANADFGVAVAGVGDVNGDGVADIAIGANFQDVGGNDKQGQAFVFSGADGSHLRTLDDPTPEVFVLFGSSLAGVGDVNSDGVPDIAVGASLQDVGSNADQGEVFVFSGADGSHLRTLDDPNPQAQGTSFLPPIFGVSVVGVGDVNGDGTPDIAVGASGQDVNGHDDQGEVFVFSGADGSHLRTFDDPNPQVEAGFGAFFGVSLAALGDLNGDGLSEISIGADDHDAGGNVDQGQAFVFSVADGALLRTLDDPNPQASADFGNSLAGVGDVNGDGAPDIAVGAVAQNVGGNTLQGQAYVLSGANGALLLTLDDPNSQAGAFFAFSLAALGDVNGDGAADLLVGAELQDVGGNEDQGQAFVFSLTGIVRTVTIDIKPGTFPNTINPHSRGVTPVAILTTATFDATTVDPTKVRFGATGTEAAAVHTARVDVDGDGDIDLLFSFRTRETGIVCGATSASLTGQTLSGQAIAGSDSIVTVGCP